MSNFRKQWNDTCKAAGLASITKNTAAQILAVIYILGGEREIFTHNEKLKADLEYIQQMYGFDAGMTPDAYVSERFKHYANELNHCGKHYPLWATKLMNENYGIKL